MDQRQGFEERLLSIDEAGLCLGLSPWTIRAWIRDGKIISHKLGSRRLVPVTEIARLLEQSRKPATQKLTFA